MIIRGYFNGRNPFVRASIWMPEAEGRSSFVEMAVDTGSSLTVLRRSVVEKLGLDVALDFPDRPLESAKGIGGWEDFVRLRVHLRFSDSEPQPEKPYAVFVRVALRRDDADSVPSLLGMDIMDSFRITVSAREDIVELEPKY